MITIDTLVDTGAQRSLMNASTYSQLKRCYPELVLHPTRVTVTCSLNQNFVVHGEVTFQASLYSQPLGQMRFIVVDTLPIPIIFGMDELQQRVSKIDIDNHKLILKPEIIRQYPATISYIAANNDVALINAIQAADLDAIITEAEPRITSSEKPDNSINEYLLAHILAPPKSTSPSVLEILRDAITEADDQRHDLTANQQAQLYALFTEFIDVFAVDPKQPSQTSIVEHEIRLKPNAKPVSVNQYRMPYVDREFLKAEVQRLLQSKLISPSTSPWGASPVIVPKKGDKRMCIDYRALNDLTENISYPMPFTTDLLEQIGKAKYFSSIDLASGYWQIRMNEASKRLTTFNSFLGSFEWNVMPFGLKTAPATFQKLMDEIFYDLKEKFLAVYFDDIFIYSHTFEEHLQHLRIVFEKLRASQLQAKATKCHFVRKEIVFIGHRVTQEGLRPDTSKMEAIRSFPRPKGKRQLRQFLGLANYYARFIPDRAKICKLLNEITGPKTPFRWTDAHTEAFELVKQALLKNPVLRMPDFSKRFVLCVDASGIGMGAVLSQIEEDAPLSNDHINDYAIAYASKAFTLPQRNYSISDKEGLAIVFAVKYFKVYLIGNPFTIYTDHQALTFLSTMKNSKELSGRLFRYQQFLSQFQYSIVYRTGNQNGNADSLSRNPLAMISHILELDKPLENINKTTDDNYDDVLINLIFSEDEALNKFRVMQQADPEIQEIVKQLVASKDGKVERYEFQNNLVFRVKKLPAINDEEEVRVIKEYLYPPRLVVPKELQAEILYMMHSDYLTGGHVGENNVYEKVKQRFYWRNMRADVANLVGSCPTCNQHRAPNRPVIAPNQPHRTSGTPFTQISFDALGPLPVTIPGGNRHILVFVDRFTKWCECYAVPDVTAKTVATTLINDFITRHGCPQTILSDNAKAFTGETMTEIYTYLNAQKYTTTSYNPRHNGQVERFNHSLIAILKAVVNKYQTDWDQHINACQFIYRISTSTSTGFSPFLLVYGRQPKLPVDIWYNKPLEYADKRSYLASYLPIVNWIRDQAKDKLLRRCEALTSVIVKLFSRIDYAENQRVYLHLPSHVPGLSDKLRPTWKGPFQIIKRISPLNYRVKDRNGKIITANVRLMKSVDEPSPLSQRVIELSSDLHPLQQETANIKRPDIILRGDREQLAEFQDNDINVFEVEKILDKRIFRGKTQYLVKWTNYDDSYNSYQDEEDFIEKDIIREYEEELATKQ